MGERLLYLPSLGFAIAFAWLLYRLVKRISGATLRPAAILAVALPITVLAAVKTVTRNTEWKSNTTLFIADVKHVPESIKANISAGTQYISLADDAGTDADKHTYTQQAIPYFNRAIALYDTVKAIMDARQMEPENFYDPYFNLGGAYHRLGRFTEAANTYLKVPAGAVWFRQNGVSVTQAFRAAADSAMTHRQPAQAVVYLQRALEYAPNDVELIYRMGGAYFMQGDRARARETYEKCANLAPNRPDIWYNLGGFYYTTQDFPSAIAAFERCLQLQPENMDAQRGLQAAQMAMGR
jgi:Flp pilus assembly protein TadD